MAARLCGTCSRKVYPNEKISIGSELVMAWYHKGCLVCKECGTTLSMTSISSQGGMIYCAKHIPKRQYSVVLDSMSLKRAKNAPKIQIMGLLKTKVGLASFKGLTLRAKAIAAAVGAQRPARGQLGVQRGIISAVDPNVRPVNRIDEEDESGAVSDIDKELAALRDRLDKLKQGVDEEDNMDFDVTEDEANILAEHFNLPPATIRMEAQKLAACSSKREAGDSLTALFVPPGSTIKRTPETQDRELKDKPEILSFESKAAVSKSSSKETVDSVCPAESLKQGGTSFISSHVEGYMLASVSSESKVDTGDTQDEELTTKSLVVPKSDYLSTVKSMSDKITVTSEEPSYVDGLTSYGFSSDASIHVNRASLMTSFLDYGHGRKPSPYPSDDGFSIAIAAPASIHTSSMKERVRFSKQNPSTIVAA